MMYHIFSIYDYKGGELISHINLSKELFYDIICDIFLGKIERKVDNIDDITISDLEELLKEIITNVNYYSEYANDNTYSGQWYYTDKEGKLILINPEDIDFNEMAKSILMNK